MIHLKDEDVARLISPSKAFELVKESYTKLEHGNALNPPRLVLPVPGGAAMYFMPAHVYGQQTVTIKVARVNSDNSKRSLPTVLLTLYVYDSVTGVQIAEIEGGWLTAVRTAASSALATKLLAKVNAKVLGIYGSGTQASFHARLLSKVRNFDTIIVYSRNRQRRDAFVQELSHYCRASVVASDSPNGVAQESDVIVTATTSDTPVFDGSLVKPGTYVNAIGSASPETREVDTSLVRRSKVVVDSRPQALATYGEIIFPLKEGAIQETDIFELGELLVDIARFNRLPREVTLFKSGGLGVLDAVFANYVVESLAITGSPTR